MSSTERGSPAPQATAACQLELVFFFFILFLSFFFSPKSSDFLCLVKIGDVLARGIDDVIIGGVA